jgi:hypothetical protein
MVMQSEAPFGIRLAALADLPKLADVERSAAEAFQSLPNYVASGRTIPPEVLGSMIAASKLWVADHASAGIIGFVGCRDVGEILYVHEISVALMHRRRV